MMEFKSFPTGTNDSQRRLDKVIRNFLPDSPLSSIYKYIRKGLIKVNQHKTTAEYHIQTGDEIQIACFILEKTETEEQIVPESPSSFAVENLPPVVFKNEHIIIFNKPYNVTVHGYSDSLDVLVKKSFPNNEKSLSFSPGPLHRLDKKTTGLIAFSQSLLGAQWFSKNIQSHNITKKYITVLQGNLNQKQEWKDNIEKAEKTINGFHVVQQSDDGSFAHTIATPLLHGFFQKTPFTLAEMEIKTGKTHQIRAQSSIHGFPLLGDTAYNGKKLPPDYPDFFLQAVSLSFPKDNPLNLPEMIEIEYSEALIFFLKDCDVTI